MDRLSSVHWSHPPFWGYPGREFAGRIAGGVFAHTTALGLNIRRAGISGTVMPLNGDRKSSKTLVSSGSRELFHSDVRATTAMLERHGRVSIY
jgi:hypothetical protein